MSYGTATCTERIMIMSRKKNILLFHNDTDKDVVQNMKNIMQEALYPNNREGEISKFQGTNMVSMYNTFHNKMHRLS